MKTPETQTSEPNRRDTLQLARDAVDNLLRNSVACPNDTDGDGDCGRPGCPVCGTAAFQLEMNTPFDAPSRRAKRLAYIEHSKTIRAFHDGADTPEVRSAIERARDKALKAVRARKSANAETEL